MDTMLLSSEVLKATSGNGARRLKAKQETRVATRATKTAEAAMKQIVAQELQAEKFRMQEWKQQVMAEVAHQLQGIRTAYTEEMEAQRQSFQAELEGAIERLEQAETRSEILEEEIRALKSPKPTQEKRPAQSTPAAKKVSLDATNTPAPTDSGVKPSVEKCSYALIAASKPVQSSEQPWTQVSYGNRKPSGRHRTTAKVEQMGRRILFPRNQEGQKKSEADLMLALNEALQKAGEESHVRFCRVKYAPSGAISALLNENADAGLLMP